MSRRSGHVAVRSTAGGAGGVQHKGSVQEVLYEFNRKKHDLEQLAEQETASMGTRQAKITAALDVTSQERFGAVQACIADAGEWLEGIRAQHSKRNVKVAEESKKVIKRLRDGGGALEQLEASKQKFAHTLCQLQDKCIREDKAGPASKRSRPAKSVSFQ